MLTQDQWNAAIRAVCLKAADDPVFHEKAQSDPLGAIKAATGLELSPTLPVRFVDALDELVYVLPQPRSGSVELSNRELEQAAGGAGCGWTAI